MVLSKEEMRRLDGLFRKHQDDVFRTCLRFAAGDRQWALDRSQDVFVKLAKELPRLRDIDDLGGWLYRVAANSCLMELRREKGWFRVSQILGRMTGRVAPSPEAQVCARRDLSDFEVALRELPANERALLTLVYLDGKSQIEAAEVLGFSKGHVSKLHRRALQRLERQDWETPHG